MPAELPIKCDKISIDQLVEIYRLFCQAYEIEFGRQDERFMGSRGIQDLHDGHLDYIPFYGAKFFGESRGNSTKFWDIMILKTLASIQMIKDFKN